MVQLWVHRVSTCGLVNATTQARQDGTWMNESRVLQCGAGRFAKHGQPVRGATPVRTNLQPTLHNSAHARQPLFYLPFFISYV